jgi:acyl-CoA reductase-like NAD-dependent aldehyde dehydrogenase
MYSMMRSNWSCETWGPWKVSPSKGLPSLFPQVSQLQFDRIMEYINHGKTEGATVALGGERHGTEGYFKCKQIHTVAGAVANADGISLILELGDGNDGAEDLLLGDRPGW